MRLKYNIEFFKKLAIERGGECLSNEYIACDKKLKFKCSLGHIWETKPYYLVNNNSWCPQCNKSNKDNIELFKQIAIDRGGECLSDVYVNCRTKLKFICSEKHTWDAKPHDVKFSKSWCPICSNSRKLTIEEMDEIASKRGGKCLSETYIDSHTKLLWECKYGHQWKAKPSQIKNINTWCPECNESKGERMVGNILTNKKIIFERQKTFDDCVGKKYKLLFDFYLPEDNVLIEYDGEQHYKPKSFHRCSVETAKKSFNDLKINDNIKNEYCIKNNITLIRIPYTIKDVEEYLLTKLDNVMKLIS